MKKIALFCLVAGFFWQCQSNTSNSNGSTDETGVDTTATVVYDSLKAKAYGADDYGMKSYVFAFLYKGDSTVTDQKKARELQQLHLKNIGRLAEDNTLVMAGPFMDKGDLRGIYIFDVETIDEAKALTESDPAIQAGVLKMVLKKWYGSAGLTELNTIHESLMKKSISE